MRSNLIFDVCTEIFREKNKRFAEQGAAIVCLCAEGLVEIETLVKDGSILQ